MMKARLSDLRRAFAISGMGVTPIFKVEYGSGPRLHSVVVRGVHHVDLPSRDVLSLLAVRCLRCILRFSQRRPLELAAALGVLFRET